MGVGTDVGAVESDQKLLPLISESQATRLESVMILVSLVVTSSCSSNAYLTLSLDFVNTKN